MSPEEWRGITLLFQAKGIFKNLISIHFSLSRNLSSNNLSQVVPPEVFLQKKKHVLLFRFISKLLNLSTHRYSQKLFQHDLLLLSLLGPARSHRSVLVPRCPVTSRKVQLFLRMVLHGFCVHGWVKGSI